MRERGAVYVAGLFRGKSVSGHRVFVAVKLRPQLKPKGVGAVTELASRKRQRPEAKVATPARWAANMVDAAATESRQPPMPLESSAISDEESAGETAREDHRGESATVRIEAALDEQLKSPLQYEDQPLNEVIDTLQEEYDIPILFDVAALEEVAIAPETEVTINLRDISLRSALNLMLRQPGLEDLTVVIDEEVLLITTEEKANEKLTVEVYRVDDLIRGYQPPGEGTRALIPR